MGQQYACNGEDECNCLEYQITESQKGLADNIVQLIVEELGIAPPGARLPEV